MYSFKTMILRLLEVYENSPKSVKGRMKFFNAWAIAYTFNFVFNKKKYSLHHIHYRNILFMNWRKNPQFYEVQMIEQIDNDYLLISLVVDSIKDEYLAPNMEYDIIRTKIAGCIGTVVY